MNYTDEKIIEYLYYLDRYGKKHKLNRLQSHQHALCREVAKEYGLTEDEMMRMDENS